MNNQERYEGWEKYVLSYSDNECEGWNHLNAELKTATCGLCYDGKRYWKEVGCVVSMAVVLLLPWTSSPYKGNCWNLSFTQALTLYFKRASCVLSSGLSQFLQDNWWSIVARPQGIFTDWPYIYPICGCLCNHLESSRAAALPSPCLSHPMPDINLDQPCPYGSYTVSDPCLGVQRWEKGGPFPALKQLSTVSSGTIEPLMFILSLSG